MSVDGPENIEPDRALTVLTCAPGLLATKRIVAGADGLEIVEHDRLKYLLRAGTLAFGGLDGLHRLLLRLDPRRRTFVIRAMLRDGVDPRRVRRTKQRDPDTGEAPCFRPIPRAWAAFDFDSVPAPAGLDPVREPVEAGMFLRDLLPDPLPECACVVQATSGCGFKPGLRYRLRFVLGRALHGHEIDAWCGGAPLDPATLRDVEPIYTARPIVEGAADPVPRRIVRLDGLSEVVEVPDRLPDDQRAPTSANLAATGAMRGGGFDGHLAGMGDGEGLGGFRGPMLSAPAAYAAAHGADALERDAGTVRLRIAGVIAVAPEKPGRGPELERYLSERHFAELVGWVAVRQRQTEREAREGAIIAAALAGRAAP